MEYFMRKTAKYLKESGSKFDFGNGKRLYNNLVETKVRPELDIYYDKAVKYIVDLVKYYLKDIDITYKKGNLGIAAGEFIHYRINIKKDKLDFIIELVKKNYEDKTNYRCFYIKFFKEAIFNNGDIVELILKNIEEATAKLKSETKEK